MELRSPMGLVPGTLPTLMHVTELSHRAREGGGETQG